jgi:hypothetical protein
VAAMKSNQMAATTPTPDVSIMKKKQEGKYYYVKLLYIVNHLLSRIW